MVRMSIAIKQVSKKTIGILASLFVVAGCSPKVTVAAPDKPIEINLNVNIKHEIKVKVEKELEEAISEESGLF